MNRYEQQAYWEMILRAEYYSWSALRGHSLSGNEPIYGMPRGRGCRKWNNDGENRAGHSALAKYWLKEARNYRHRITTNSGDSAIR